MKEASLKQTEDVGSARKLTVLQPRQHRVAFTGSLSRLLHNKHKDNTAGDLALWNRSMRVTATYQVSESSNITYLYEPSKSG